MEREYDTMGEYLNDVRMDSLEKYFGKRIKRLEKFTFILSVFVVMFILFFLNH